VLRCRTTAFSHLSSGAQTPGSRHGWAGRAASRRPRGSSRRSAQAVNQPRGACRARWAVSATAAIVVIRNRREANSPGPAAGRKPETTSPIEQRFHRTCGSPLRADLPRASSPDRADRGFGRAEPDEPENAGSDPMSPTSHRRTSRRYREPAACSQTRARPALWMTTVCVMRRPLRLCGQHALQASGDPTRPAQRAGPAPGDSHANREPARAPVDLHLDLARIALVRILHELAAEVDPCGSRETSRRQCHFSTDVNSSGAAVYCSAVTFSGADEEREPQTLTATFAPVVVNLMTVASSIT